MKSNWINKIINHPLVNKIKEWSQNYALPGFGGVPIYTIILFLYEAYTKDRLVTRANSIAFNFMLAIFPALIFLFTLLPYLPVTANYTELFMNSLDGVMPETAHNYLKEIVESIYEIKKQGLLSFGFILAVVFSSNGMLSLMTAFNKRDKVHYKKRTVIRERLIALLLTIAIGILFLLSLVLIVVGNQIFVLLEMEEKLPKATQFLIISGKWLATFLIIYSGVTLIYRYAPRLRKRISIVNPGSIMVTILSLLTSIIFSYAVNEFGRYNELYGTFGALIVIMIWLQMNAFIILAGFELNASITVNSKQSNKELQMKLLEKVKD